MTLQEVREKLGVSRQRVSRLIQEGALSARFEIGADGRVRRLVPRVEVDALVARRQRQAEEMQGPGRRPRKLPEP